MIDVAKRDGLQAIAQYSRAQKAERQSDDFRQGRDQAILEMTHQCEMNENLRIALAVSEAENKNLYNALLMAHDGIGANWCNVHPGEYHLITAILKASKRPILVETAPSAGVIPVPPVPPTTEHLGRS